MNHFGNLLTAAITPFDKNGVIETDKVLEPVTKEEDVVVLCVLSVALTTCKILPKPVPAVPETLIVSPD